MNSKQITENDEVIPLEFHLSQNYPNPFKEKTTIKYCVAYKTRVQITVYDAAGNEIEKLVDEERQPGTYEIEFCVAQDSCPATKEGTYSYRFEAGEYICEKKMEISFSTGLIPLSEGK
jgi:hypothetical protein